MNPFEIRSPRNDKAIIQIPAEVSTLSVPFNGSVCSGSGDEYTIRNNIVNLIEAPRDISWAQSTNHWKITASLYEDLWRKRSLTFLTKEDFPIDKEKELLLEWVDPQPGKRYLDIGCSTALYARALKQAEHGIAMVAIDFSMQMLEEARIKAEADQADILFLRADILDMPFFANTFDGLLMGGTFNELTDDLKALFECRRIIKEDGVFFMMHLVKSEAWYERLFQDSAEWGGIRFQTVDESNQLFKRTGFEVREQITKGIVCFSKLVPV